MIEPGADLGFLRGVRAELQKISKILSTFFLGRPNKFSELSKIMMKTPFLPHFLRRKQILAPKAPLEKFKGHSAKNGYLEIV